MKRHLFISALIVSTLVWLVTPLSVAKEKPYSYNDHLFPKDTEFKEFIVKYKNFDKYKAIALALKADGSYYSHYVVGARDQSTANNDVVKGCEESKPLDSIGECKLFMVDTYLYSYLPQLDQMKGIWEGEIIQYKMGSNKNYGTGLINNFKLINCDNHPELWMTSREYTDGNKLRQINLIFDIDELKGNITLSSAEHKEGWVETQFWAFVAIGQKQAVVQRNRLVNNFKLDISNPKRFFGSIGHGELLRTSTCT